MTDDRPTISVLVVEDSPADLDLIKERLAESEEAYFEVQAEGRLERARHQFAIRVFDIVLLDLGLPDSSGLRTLETFLEWDTGIPVVVLTGLAEDILGTQAVELGAQAYRVKRLDSFKSLPADLLAVVEQHRATEAEASSGPLGWLRRLFGGS